MISLITAVTATTVTMVKLFGDGVMLGVTLYTASRTAAKRRRYKSQK
jgi:hypothetical protein